MEKFEKYQKNSLTREEAKKILGGKENPDSPAGCPDNSHEFTCHYGTNWITYCVDNAFNNPDCSGGGYIGWVPNPGYGVPGPVREV